MPHSPAVFEILASLEVAMEQAGGKFDMSYLLKLSAPELLSFLAPNDIRFVYKPKRVHRKKTNG